MKTPDVVQAKVPGAMLALFAFMLTVLLGIGGTSDGEPDGLGR